MNKKGLLIGLGIGFVVFLLLSGLSAFVTYQFGDSVIEKIANEVIEEIEKSPEGQLAKTYFNENLPNEDYTFIYFDQTLIPYETKITIELIESKEQHIVLIKKDESNNLYVEKSTLE